MIRILHDDARDVLRSLPDAPRNRGWFVKGSHWRPRKPHWDRDWLAREYTTNARSASDIASETGVTTNAILFWLAKHSIARRSMSETRSIKRWGAAGPNNPMHGKVGALNPRYIDGSSPERQRAYAKGEGRAFLREILSRDGYQCRRCGEPKDAPRSLHVHHLIKPWAGNPDLRFDSANNVVTVCRACHGWIHSAANVALEWLL